MFRIDGAQGEITICEERRTENFLGMTPRLLVGAFGSMVSDSIN